MIEKKEGKDYTHEFMQQLVKAEPWRKVFFGILSVALVDALIAGYGTLKEYRTLTLVAAIVMAALLAGLIVAFRRLSRASRCPACGKRLGRHLASACPFCAATLIDTSGMKR